jgi:flagellar M-ring protein FliF
LGGVLNIWSALQPRQRLIAGLALVAILAAGWGLWQAARTPPLALLYSGLDPQAAAEVGGAVQAMGIEAEVQGGEVRVPGSERDRARLALAAQGLPRSGPAGYEILDQLDGFGATSEMFAAAYWRAKEGELARTVLAAPGVRAARVHIANPVGRPFQRGAKPSASITVTTSYGPLDAGQAEAIRYLVASAVAGLTPDAVSVIDAAHGVVLRMGEAGDGRDAAQQGASREAVLRGEIERLLAARVGEGKAIVTVAVETSAESETTVERLLDPNRRVAISTDTRELSDSGTGGAGGGATVASNLPVEGGGAAAGGQRSRTETEERVNYEVSETTRELTRKAGEVKRVTVAVLVDGVGGVAADGTRSWQPRPEAEIEQLRDLVRAAVGFDEERGDVVTVETLEFADRPTAGSAAEGGVMTFLERNAMQLIQMGVLSAVALGLALFVVRPILRAAENAPILQPDRLPPPLEFGEVEEVQHKGPVDHVGMLREMFAEQRSDSANVLRSWLERDVQANIEAENENGAA